MLGAGEGLPSGSMFADEGRWPGTRLTRRRVDEAVAGGTDAYRSTWPWRPTWPWSLPDVDIAGFFGEDTTPSTTLKVLVLDQLIASNRRRHHTTDYHVENLVLRRGEPFDLELKLSRPYEPRTDKIRLEFQMGRAPLESRGSLVVAAVDERTTGRSTAWATVSRSRGDLLTLSVCLAPNCIVGRFEMYLVTETDGRPQKSNRHPDTDLYVLFNPWCKEDQVYLAEDSWRREYVLNDTGCLYLGTSEQIGTHHWNFGQFEPGILDVCVSLLDKGELVVSSRGNPIDVSRTASAVVNANDEGGVVLGRWSGSYDDGTSPAAWNGSVDILLRYGRTGRSVRYGQCWVFSGVLTTVLRCLGIPCRSISNFDSMHDQNANLTMDTYLDQDMWPIDSLNHDSIWNFHVWNEAWMARPDLLPGNDGWQIVDSTPQEQSNGVMQCGPAPQAAVKHGHVHIPHDTPFVFAEVNGDRVYWVWGKDWRFHEVYTDTSVIGKNISTKAIGSNRREDITDQYKFPEGSAEERRVMALALTGGREYTAYRASPMAARQPRLAPDDLGISFSVGEARIGADLTVAVRVVNETQRPASITVNIQGDVVFYTGIARSHFKRDSVKAALKPNEAGEVAFVVSVSDYLPQLSERGAMKFTVTARVDDTGFVATKSRTVILLAPPLHLAPVGNAKVGKEMSTEVTFKNPLPVRLTNVSCNMEGADLLTPTIKIFRDINVGETISLTQSFTPTKAGARTLMASLQSKELYLVTGTLEMTVAQ